MLVTFTCRSARRDVEVMKRWWDNRRPRFGRDFPPHRKSAAATLANLLGYDANFTILDSEDQLDLIRLAMDDAKLTGTGKLAPKASLVHHLISFAANINRPLGQLIADRGRRADPLAGGGSKRSPRPMPKRKRVAQVKVSSA